MVEQLAPQGWPQLSPLTRNGRSELHMSMSVIPDTSRPKPLRLARPRHMSLTSHINDHGTYASALFKSDGGADSISFHHWSLCVCYDSRVWIVGGLKPSSLSGHFTVLSNLSLSY